MESLEDKLRMPNAAKRLSAIGRWLVDVRPLTLWQRDTMTLDRGARKWRKRALDFSRRHIRPVAFEADYHHKNFDVLPLMNLAARNGMLSVLMIPPLGRASVRPYLKSAVFQAALIGEEFSVESGGIGLLFMAHYLGLAPLLLAGHIPTYVRHYLPLQYKSKTEHPVLMAFAITEPQAGSDVEHTEGGAKARLVTTAEPCDGGYRLNGSKVFISNGKIAQKLTLFAQIGQEGLDSWTCFLLDKEMPGLSVGRQERKMGQRPSDASEIILQDVFVPHKNVVGKLRDGWAINKNVLNYSRPVVGAMALGQARGAFERTLEFCRETFLGDKRLLDYQDVQLQLAEMIIQLWAARSMVWHSCSQLRSNPSASAAAKVFASDTAYKVCTMAMELMGDHAYLGKYGVERALRDTRLAQIYEGTNQINRLGIIEQQWDVELSAEPS